MYQEIITRYKEFKHAQRLTRFLLISTPPILQKDHRTREALEFKHINITYFWPSTCITLKTSGFDHTYKMEKRDS